ncbi:MAG TPA: TlpA disulfide reductase family protein [Anaerolineae bacterium]|nr:TlpA disulfide reductase family protein [Anaerolineae bacterium]
MEPYPEIDLPQPRRRSPVGTAAAAVGLVVVLLLGYSLVTGPSSAPLPGSEVPSFQLSAFDGSSMELNGQPGKVVVVNFFASWCNPCREEAGDLEAAWQQYRERDVQFYAIAYKDAASKARAFVDEFGITFPSSADPGNRIARSYGVTGVPETFVIDRQGLLVRHFLGPISSGELGLALDEALRR